MTTPQQELTQALLDYLYETHANGPRENSHWVMNQEWFDACLAAARWPGDDPGILHGLPVTVDEREGFPRVDQYVRVRDGLKSGRA